jgi:hypothetical protein
VVHGVVDSFVSWPADMLRPTISLQARLARRIGEGTGKPLVMPPTPQWREPEWEHVAGDRVQADRERFRDAPDQHAGAPSRWGKLSGAYPCRVEELHLLAG